MEVCNCPTFCVYNLGPINLPDSPHSAGFIWDIQQGHSDGVNLSGTIAALAYDMPGAFPSTEGTARLYVGESGDAEQRRELEAILTGQRGGFFELSNSWIPNKLPVRSTSISLDSGDEPAANVGDVAQVTLRRYRTQSGTQTTLNDAEYVEPFGITSEQLCDSSGSRWSDPDLREWNGGAGGIAPFKMSA